MNRSEITIAVGTAVLSFVGAVFGVFAGARLEQANWERRFALEQNRLLLEKRVAVIERAVVILNKKSLMNTFDAFSEVQRKIAKFVEACLTGALGKKAIAHGCANTKVDPDKAEHYLREMHALNSEFMATASLAHLYFGDETRKAFQAFAGKFKGGWWTADDRAIQTLIDPMWRALNELPKR